MVASKIFSGDTDLTGTVGTGLPHGPVGQIGRFSPSFSANCTATLVERNVVVSAAHCFCDKSANPPVYMNAFPAFFGFRIPAPNPSKQIVYVPPIHAISYHLMGPESDICEDFDFFDGGPTDLACLILDETVPTSAVPALPFLHTGADFMPKFFTQQQTARLWKPTMIPLATALSRKRRWACCHLPRARHSPTIRGHGWERVQS